MTIKLMSPIQEELAASQVQMAPKKYEILLL